MEKFRVVTITYKMMDGEMPFTEDYLCRGNDIGMAFRRFYAEHSDRPVVLYFEVSK